MTNREKFKEVFGFTPRENAQCVAPASVCIVNNGICVKDKQVNADVKVGFKICPFWMWWDREYKPCFKIKEDLDE